MAALQNLNWKTKVRAWWEGYDLSALKSQQKKPAFQAEEQEQDDTGGKISPFWTRERIKVNEFIFGQGHTTPTTPEHIAALIKPMGLDDSKSVLDIGAGLGGVTRYMGREAGAWVEGVEDDPVLAYAGMLRSCKAGIEKKAAIAPCEYELLSPGKKFDAIFSKEVFFQIKHKENLFAFIKASMKERGHLCFTDYVLKHSQKPHDKVREWFDEEEPRPMVWSVSQYTDLMFGMGFDIRITEDISDKHRAMIMASWAEIPEPLVALGKRNPAAQTMIVEEAERWMRRVAAIETGDVRVFRFYALGP
jgi:cyclopropane fatty-acyl-phospholipid synthase-like methyltransferase